ncbi:MULTISPECIES: hypothetical protein [unclassified Streptomyces]|uniref:hypothetical protein n=1 Tax=unclassified Streptomyces TaxID=2593676 RepID=UPI0034213CED
MSTTRRPLGTGPTTSTRTTATPSSRTGLLPAERIDVEHQDVADENPGVRMLRGRRPLGTGVPEQPGAGAS